MRKSLTVSLLSIALVASSVHDAQSNPMMGMPGEMMGGMATGGATQANKDTQKKKVYEQIIRPVDEVKGEDMTLFLEKQKEDATFMKLHYHAQQGNEDGVSQAIASGENINAPDAKGNVALYYAAAEGHMHIVKLLTILQAKVDAANSKGITPLYAAVIGKHMDVAEFLVQSGADVNALDAQGNALGFYVVQLPDRAGDVRWLHKQGLNVFLKNSEGKTMLKVSKTSPETRTTYEYLKKVYTKAVNDYYKKRGQEAPESALTF